MRPKLAVLLLLTLTTSAAAAQESQPPETGWEFFGLPALNFNSDEGFGYGALLDLYNYGSGVKPYRFMIRPLVLITTKGRRDVAVLFDAPKLLPPGWRLDAYVGREQQLAMPYYGIGNLTRNDTSLSKPPDAYYYRYGRTQVRLAANVQREVRPSARMLLGLGYVDVKTDATPFDSGTTLMLLELQSQQGVQNPTSPSGTLVYLRGGFVLDTRDREIGPSRGHWVDLAVQRVAEALGSSSSYTRATITGRKYESFSPKLVFAQRLALQQVYGNVPVFDLTTLQTTQLGSSQPEVLGGSGSVRGVLKDRFIGKAAAFSNSELRWRFKELKILKKPAYLVGSAFFDVGRVWPEKIELADIVKELHAGYGGGLRLGLGPSFLVAFDIGKSSESTQIYIGLGYPF